MGAPLADPAAGAAQYLTALSEKCLVRTFTLGAGVLRAALPKQLKTARTAGQVR